MRRMSYEDVARKRAHEDLRLIDVREQDEYDAVHVRNVELFPLSQMRRGDLPEQDERPVALICQTGARSAIACHMLEGAGWPECINVQDGTLAAMQAGDDHVEWGSSQGPRF